MTEEMDPAFAAIRAEMLEEYGMPHDMPWVIGLSGKDSTLVVHLAVEILLSIAPSRRTRHIHVVTNDTLVESPLVCDHLRTVQGAIADGAAAMGLPITVATTRPNVDETFWVNLIGRGYATPNQTFRWCTPRLKIAPTARYIAEQVSATGGTILLLGVRRAESTARARSIDSHVDAGRLNPHGNIQGCMVYRPIADLSTESVWEFLATRPPPWGSTHDGLIALYRAANSGECIFATQGSDVGACGTTSSRLGCWTCTVVSRDRSMMGFVAAGHDDMAPLVEYRDWLASIRNDPSRRQALRRDGRAKFTDAGALVPGPFTIETRMEMLSRLTTLEGTVRRQLISPAEQARIRDIWAEDALRAADRLASQVLR